MTARDGDADYRALTPSARLYSTDRPHLFYWAAGVECVFFAALGVWIMTRSIVGGILVIGIAILASLGTAWPSHWSEQHPDQAHQAVGIQRERRNRMARRHPAYFLVVVPLITALTAALRFNRNRHHPSPVDWLVPAALGLVVGLALGAILIYRAHHSHPSRSLGNA